MAQTSPFSASKESKAILLSKTTFAREFRDICCPAVAFAVDSAMVAKVKDTILITYLYYFQVKEEGTIQMTPLQRDTSAGKLLFGQ